jgi:hypothetical protein
MEEQFKERQRGSNDFLGERGLTGLALFVLQNKRFTEIIASTYLQSIENLLDDNIPKPYNYRKKYRD